MRTFLCTVGTSSGRYFGLEKLTDDWVSQQGGPRIATRQVLASLPAPPEDLRDLSAEIAPLVRNALCADDRVVLYCSDTEVGETLSLVLTELLATHYDGLEVVHRRVPGLQVQDERRFRQEGVVNFVKLLGADIDQFGQTTCILNPLGGYKALVPYSVLVAMVRRIPVQYIFEGTETLLTLPALPLDFPTSLMEALSAVFEMIERESSLSLTDFRKRLGKSPADEQLAALFEIEGNDVTLSAVGYLLSQTLRENRPLVPYISRKAIDEICQLAAREDCRPFEFLNRVSQSAHYFESKRHGSLGDGLVWLKPGNTTDRYLISVEQGWRLLVWRAVEHTEYDKLSDRPGLAATLRSSQADFEPFLRMELFAPRSADSLGL